MEGRKREEALYEGIYNSGHSFGQAAPLDGIVTSAGRIYLVALHSFVHLETLTSFASFLGAGENDELGWAVGLPFGLDRQDSTAPLQVAYTMHPFLGCPCRWAAEIACLSGTHFG